MANENAQTVEAVKTVSTVKVKPEKVINKTITRCKLLCAKSNKNGDKIGVALLDYAALINGNQLDCLSLESPVITKWFSLTPQLVELMKKPVLSDVACVVSGEGNYTILHEVLSDDEYLAYKKLIG